MVPTVPFAGAIRTTFCWGSRRRQASSRRPSSADPLTPTRSPTSRARNPSFAHQVGGGGVTRKTMGSKQYFEIFFFGFGSYEVPIDFRLIRFRFGFGFDSVLIRFGFSPIRFRFSRVRIVLVWFRLGSGGCTRYSGVYVQVTYLVCSYDPLVKVKSPKRLPDLSF